MDASNPGQQSDSMADERAVRTFLERAAPIILESPVLEGKRLAAVVALAEELDLTSDQLACELQLLEQRGVILSLPWAQLDALANEANVRSGAPQTGDPETSSQAMLSQQAKAAPSRPAKPRAASDELPDDDSGEASVSPPASTIEDALPTETIDVSTTAAAESALRERAVKLMTQRGTLSPRTRRKLEKAGKQAGLSKNQVATVLDNLPQSDSSDGPPVRRPALSAKEPAPSVTTPTPSESFRRWIDQKLSGYPSSLLAIDDENGLVGVGQHRYHLAEVLATHIVRDVATERGLRLERDLDAASCNSTVGASAQMSEDSEQLETFFEQVAPILTQHRGINAQSRVMMNAVAKRLGLSEGELERALITLQRRVSDPAENDPRQLERRESFRAYLRRAMAHLPNGIITFKTEQTLCQAGEHFHGVTPHWIKPTIKEVAAEIGARFISKEQALEHVTQLTEDQLADRPIIDSATRSKIYTAGTQWGLDPMEIDTILRQRTETLRRQLAAERKRSRWVINFVIGGLAIGATMLVMMVLLGPMFRKPSSQPVTSPKKATTSTPQLRTGMSWWDSTLRVAAAKTRVMRRDLRPALDAMKADYASARGKAYREAVDQLAQKVPLQGRQAIIDQLLTSLFALEPSDSAANSLARGLLNPITDIDKGLPEDRSSVAAMFWSCRTAVALLKHPDTPVLRRNRLREELDEATGTLGDTLLEVDALQQVYQGALARRLYQTLLEQAAVTPARAGSLLDTVHTLARGKLDEDTLGRLELNVFSAAATAGIDNLRPFIDTIHRAASSSNPDIVAKILRIYQRTSDRQLHDYLTLFFSKRLGFEPGSVSDVELINDMRESLGIAAKERELRRWKTLADSTDELLDRKHVAETYPDVLLQETVELAHNATLTCMLLQGESEGSAFDEMQTEGVTRLSLARGPWASEPPDKYESSYPVDKRTVLSNKISSLTTTRSATQARELLRMIASQVDSVADVDAAAGQALAEYLTRSHADDQLHQQVLALARHLSQWNGVRLGLADQLTRTGLSPSRLSELYSAILEDNITLSTKSDRDAIRRQLLTRVANDFGVTPDKDNPEWQVFDEGSSALRELYATQARLFGIPTEEYNDSRSPSGVVNVLTRHLADQLSSASLTSDDRSTVTSVPYRTKAILFAAENDLQRTVGLQQLWLELLVIHIANENPETATAVHKTLEAAQQRARPPRVFEQLRDLQADLLRVWSQLTPDLEGIELE